MAQWKWKPCLISQCFPMVRVKYAIHITIQSKLLHTISQYPHSIRIPNNASPSNIKKLPFTASKSGKPNQTPLLQDPKVTPWDSLTQLHLSVSPAWECWHQWLLRVSTPHSSPAGSRSNGNPPGNWHGAMENPPFWWVFNQAMGIFYGYIFLYRRVVEFVNFKPSPSVSCGVFIYSVFIFSIRQWWWVLLPEFFNHGIICFHDVAYILPKTLNVSSRNPQKNHASMTTGDAGNGYLASTTQLTYA